MKKFVLRLLVAISFIYLFVDEVTSYINTSNGHIANNTLMIMGAQGGGTGVILDSQPTTSSLLTNKHVCEAIRHYGHVIKDSGEVFEILNFRESKVHDLCEIVVVGNLHGGVTLAPYSPASYDTAIVAGHPHLMPTVIMRGHFTNKTYINVGSSTNLLEVRALNILIGPGSSGSAVYNSDGQLAGMVFAGAGNIGFGYIVPYEYIAYFLNEEIRTVMPESVTPLSPSSPELTKGKSLPITLVKV